jgi:hypothetical protein
VTNSIAPKRHWFLVIQKRGGLFHIFDRLVFAQVSENLPTLDAAREELRRLKHLAVYVLPQLEMEKAFFR